MIGTPAAAAAPARRTVALALAGVVAVAALLHANTLANGFVYDDRFQVLNNPWLPDLGKIPTAFLTNVWAFEDLESNYYRPLMHVAYILTYQAFGPSAWGFHLVNVALHAAVTGLVFLLVRRVLAGAGADARAALAGAFAGGLLFAAHPIHTEVVAWVACVPDLLLALLALSALLLHLRGGRAARAGAVGCFLVGLFAKETMVAVPLALLAWEVVTERPRPGIRALARRYLPYALAVVAYLAVRMAAISGFAPLRRHPELGAAGYVVNAFPLFADYLWALLLPVRLNAFHVLHPIGSLLSVRGVLGLAAVAGFAAALVAAWRRAPDALVGLILIAAPLLPALVIPAVGENTFTERYLYLPSVGFVLLAGAAAARAVARRPAAAPAVAGVALAVAAAYAAVTVPRNAVWRSDLTLWSDTAARSPDSAYARNELGVALAEAGELARAIPEYQAAIRLDPTSALPHNNLGVVHERLGRPDLAEADYRAAVRADPRNVEARVNLGNVLSAAGRFQGAAEQYRTAAELRPRAVEPRISLGNALSGLGDREGAMAEYRRALDLDPRSPDAQLAVGIALGEAGRLDEAIPHLEAAARLAPDDPVIRANLQQAYRLRGAPGAGRGERR